MKTYIPYSLLLAAASCGLALGADTAYTTPVGYVTKSLAANQYNLVGLTLQNPTAAAGVLDAATATTVTDNQATFTTSLTAGTIYVLELPDGTVQEISSWTATTLTTPDNISSHVVAGTTAFKLRKAATISDVFGAQNSAGLKPSTDGALAGVDKVLVLNSTGTFTTVFYFNDNAGTQGWFDAGFNPAANVPVVYPDAFFVQKAGTASTLTISGEVKTTATAGVLANGYNYLSVVAPAGLTVGTSGLETSLTPSADGSITSADLVLIQKPDGTYTTCFYFNDNAGTKGWFDAGFNPAENLPIDSGILVLNKGASKAYKISTPASYSSL